MPLSGVGLVLVAAGQGTRLGAGLPKALVPLGHGPDEAPIVVHALHAALACRAVTAVVVVAPPTPEGLQQLAAAVDAAFPDRTPATSPQDTRNDPSGHALRPDRTRRTAAQDTSQVSIQVVPGGAERSDSVAAGLAALPPAVELVLVHDAARALTPVEVFDRVVATLRDGHTAVTPALPVIDTIKQVDVDASGTETVRTTIDRSTLRAVQTPQGFRRQTLVDAHQEFRRAGRGGSAFATDDCGLVETSGGRVTVVEGSPRALKITTPHDLRLAAGWLTHAAPGSTTGADATTPGDTAEADATAPGGTAEADATTPHREEGPR